MGLAPCRSSPRAACRRAARAQPVGSSALPGTVHVMLRAAVREKTLPSCRNNKSVKRQKRPPNSEPSRPALTIEERTTLCRCLNYEKLTLGACKDLAKSRRIPPGIAVQALASQQSKLQFKPNAAAAKGGRPDPSQTPRRVASLDLDAMDEKELLKLNLQKMQNRVVELERVCKEVRGQMSKMAKSKSFGTTSCHQIGGRDLPRLC